MKQLKYQAFRPLIALIFLLALWGMNACENNKPAPKNKSTTQNEGPKFRKDGDLWLQNADGDTLAALDVEYANTQSRIEYGMMYRKSMTANMSMLFFMGDMQPRSFWMKNTYVSLDIIFIDDQKRIVSIQKNAEPLNTRSLASTGPAQYVLEVKGGLCDSLGLVDGDQIAWQDLEI